MQTELKQLYADAKALHHRVIEQLALLGQGSDKLGEKIDVCFALKKAEELLDDARKEMKKVRLARERICCLGFFQGQHGSIGTTYCLSKAKAEQYIKFPHKRAKNEETFDRLMKSIGIPDEVIKHEAVRFHWNGFKELWTQRQAAGLPPLEGVKMDDTYTDFYLTYRKRKNPDE